MILFWLVFMILICVLIALEKRNNKNRIDRVVDDIKNKIMANEDRTVEEVNISRERYISLAKMLGDDDIE